MFKPIPAYSDLDLDSLLNIGPKELELNLIQRLLRSLSKRTYPDISLRESLVFLTGCRFYPAATTEAVPPSSINIVGRFVAGFC